MKTKDLVHTDAKYRVLQRFFDVKIRIPSKNDKYLEFEFAHLFTNGDKEIVQIPCHLRRGIFVENVLITRRYYILPQFIGKFIVANEVRIVSKVDKNNEKNFIIDVIKYDLEKKEAKYIIKCGSPNETENSFQIPKTDKFISFIEA